jgi:hypothetical protein
MWWRSKTSEPPAPDDNPRPLHEALRRARLEAAERTGVVVDLRDAETARLELLDDALDSLFADMPLGIELFDRAISHGDTPRLWIDAVAHVHMGRDKRVYRFVQDNRNGRHILAESVEPAEIVEAVTRYVARRILEREHMLAGDERAFADTSPRPSRRRWRALAIFLVGIVVGILSVLATAWLSVHPIP